MAGTEFTIRRKMLTILGAKFHIYDSAGTLLGFCKQKAFKLKEDIRIYTDETMSEERLCISARSIQDFSAAYDVIDSQQETKVGALQRRGFKSMLRDEWKVLDENDNQVGTLKEDSAMMAMARRVLGGWIPQKYFLADGDENHLADFRTHFNPFVHKMTVTLGEDLTLSPLLILAAGILLVAIEGRQQG